jgi:hypothetical protein
MKAMHKLSDIVGHFFVILIGIIPHRELKILTRECAIYNVERRYVKVDGHSMMAIIPPLKGDDDTRLMEMWCQMHLRQSGVWKCPVCSARNEHGNCCGHLVFERMLPRGGDSMDGKDKVLVWPDGTWHRCSDADPDAADRAIAANGWDHIVLWFPEELGDNALDAQVHDDLDVFFGTDKC